MIALDTNIFIYWLEKNPEFFSASAKIFKETYSGNITACSSTLVLSEIYSGSTEIVGAITNLPNLVISDVTKEIALVAGNLRIKHGLKVIDSIHLASAIHNKAEEFVTNDQQLAKLKIPNLKIKMLG